MMTTKITLSIPDNLKKELSQKIKETNFKSIEDYVLYVLKQMVSENDSDSSKEKVTYSDEDETALKKNLKELGYL